MANIQNLKPWKQGQSGNPSGKPKGAKHLSTLIQELMEDDSFEYKLKDGSVLSGAPIRAIITTLIIKALDGDMRAFDLLSKYGYGNKVDLTSNFSELPVPIYGGLSAGFELND